MRLASVCCGVCVCTFVWCVFGCYSYTYWYSNIKGQKTGGQKRRFTILKQQKKQASHLKFNITSSGFLMWHKLKLPITSHWTNIYHTSILVYISGDIKIVTVGWLVPLVPQGLWSAHVVCTELC